ncbi:MAG: virulence RhuM family protein [Candidatus Kaiserbacteria bacterium]|nr:virulence RhuM family protein [Candidatus Kaiserbacteria bacterium]
MPYFVYLLECEDGSLYAGVTTDVARRFKEHQAGIGSNFTRAKKAKRVVYTESQPNRSEAQKREAEIKKWPRARKVALISSGIIGDMGKKKEAVIYQAKNGAIEFRGDISRETLWATLDQIAEVFGRDKSVISRHLKKIYEEGELEERATVAKNATVQIEGNRKVERTIEYYNLDAILSVGYRVNSKTATQFRQWATKTLREHITKGYTLNRKQIAKNYDVFMKSVSDIQALLPEHVTLDPKTILELIKEFASTWVSLDAYDKESLTTIGSTKKAVKLTGAELTEAIFSLRTELLKKGEATEIFAHERTNGSIEGIVGNVMQSFGGKHVYATVEEKAAHLLYFMVKNHPFTDGNKRSGAFSFVWFLRKTSSKGSHNINPAALTALTLLIAESDPKRKDQMTALVTQMLA